QIIVRSPVVAPPVEPTGKGVVGGIVGDCDDSLKFDPWIGFESTVTAFNDGPSHIGQTVFRRMVVRCRSRNQLDSVCAGLAIQSVNFSRIAFDISAVRFPAGE